MFVECHLHAGNAFDNSINMLQCVITIHDTERIKQTPALLSLAEKKKGKKNAQVLSVSLFSVSHLPLSFALCVCAECVCISVCSGYPSGAFHRFCLQDSDLFFSALNGVDI